LIRFKLLRIKVLSHITTSTIRFKMTRFVQNMFAQGGQMKAIAFKAHFVRKIMLFAFAFASAGALMFSSVVPFAFAQAPGAPDKNKPTIPLSPAPTLGPKHQQSAPPAAASDKPDSTSRSSDKPTAQSSSAAIASPSVAAAARPPAVVAAISGAKMLSTANGVKYQDSTIGVGSVAATGQTVSVHYTGWLMEGGKLGRKFDSSIERGQPFKFPLGNGRVIKGWDEGIVGMKVGGTRVLTVPPEMAYGSRGAGAVIPPGATLVFEVKLLGV
jgi:peptidylprolyl isomerase